MLTHSLLCLTLTLVKFLNLILDLTYIFFTPEKLMPEGSYKKQGWIQPF